MSGVVEQGRRPRFGLNRDNAFWLEGAARGELRIQRCRGCGVLRHPPRPMCSDCHSVEWDAIVSSGRGTLHSFVVHHHPPVPGLPLPNVVVLVDLEEPGIRVVGDLLGADPADVEIGMPVAVEFGADPGDDLVLPHWRLVR